MLDGVLAESAVELLNSPKLWQHLPKVLSPETVDRLLAVPTADDRFPLRDRAVLTFLYATGCRASEVAGMRMTDVHLDEGFCRCLGKGNKERMVSLNPVARAAIEAYLIVRAAPTGRAIGERSALRVPPGDASFADHDLEPGEKVRRPCSAQADVSPHTLRHTFATHMLAGGAEIRALQEMLGHASVQTTQILTHVEHSRLKALHRRCHPRG